MLLFLAMGFRKSQNAHPDLNDFGGFICLLRPGGG
jgi:hypothetical protein